MQINFETPFIGDGKPQNWKWLSRKEEKQLDTSGFLGDKEQKMGKHVENITFSWVFKLNILFSKFSFFFVVYLLEGQTSEKSGNAI